MHLHLKNVVVLRLEREAVLLDVVVQGVGAQHLGDLVQLVVVVAAVEERVRDEQLQLRGAGE